MQLFDGTISRREHTPLAPGIDLFHRYWNEDEERTIFSSIARKSIFGDLGWDGARYSRKNPATGRAWPRINPLIKTQCEEIAKKLGLKFIPQFCFVQHNTEQAPPEQNNTHPEILFNFGDDCRIVLGDREIRLYHNDVLVISGLARQNSTQTNYVYPMTDGLKGRVGILVRQIY